MMTYLSISLFISLILNWYNKKIALFQNNMKIKNLQTGLDKIFFLVGQFFNFLFCIYLILSHSTFFDWAFLSATFDGTIKTDC